MSKEIIYFFFMFALMLGVITRMVFYHEEDYFDDNTTPFYTYNYQSFGASVYSGLLTSLLGTGAYEGIMRYYESSIVKCLFWLLIFLLIKFLLSNFLVGAFFNYYYALYDEEVDYMEKHPNLKNLIKQELYTEQFKDNRMKLFIQAYVETGTQDIDVKEIENFYSVTTNPKLNTKFNNNDDSMIAWFASLQKNMNYFYVMGILEGTCIFFIILALDTD